MKIFLIILNIIFINLKLSAEENLNYDTEITTDSGITLYQNEKYYELIDNVKIKSQNFNLKAENVIAYYKDDLYDLVKIIAKKNAEIDTLDGAIITGDEIMYEIESGNFFISGNGSFPVSAALPANIDIMTFVFLSMHLTRNFKFLCMINEYCKDNVLINT